MSTRPELKPLPTLPAGPVPRAPQPGIPATLAERVELRATVRRWITARNFVPPVPLADLYRVTGELLDEEGITASYRDFVGVLVNNELWRETLASVPYSRRLLLLPKCLRIEEHCPAPFDEFGLLCKKCGLCSIQDLQGEAERLGYAVLVAEGSPIVMSIIETGKIDAIVGVSCLSVLERAFPYMESAAIPGIAIPLLQGDCKDTNVDLDWVWDIVQLTADDHTRRLDLGALRDEVRSWFDIAGVAAVLGAAQGETDEIAHAWLARGGKRWRPFLTAAIHQALADDPDVEAPAELRRVAFAVECFHKASLIHDDIEDGDEVRDGEATLHAEHGVAVALNVGDWLIGEGYRLLATGDAPAETKARMLEIASEGHRTLARGQGAELCWARRPEPLSPQQVVAIFAQKTAPAFEVALQVGAALALADTASGSAGATAGVGDDLTGAIEKFSRALGVAYQIRDDLDDLPAGRSVAGDHAADDGAADDVSALRPTLPLAIAHDRARDDARDTFAALWRRELPAGFSAAAVRARMNDLGVEPRCRELLEAYREEAIRALWAIDHPGVKGLLRRVIGKILSDPEIKGWCHEFEARDAAGGEAGAAASA